jgi:hypothetical protein
MAVHGAESINHTTPSAIAFPNNMAKRLTTNLAESQPIDNMQMTLKDQVEKFRPGTKEELITRMTVTWNVMDEALVNNLVSIPKR